MWIKLGVVLLVVFKHVQTSLWTGFDLSSLHKFVTLTWCRVFTWFKGPHGVHMGGHMGPTWDIEVREKRTGRRILG